MRKQFVQKMPMVRQRVGLSPEINTHCLNFGGGNGYVNIPDTADLRPATITIEAWIKPATAGSRDCVMHSGNSGSYASNNYIFGINSTNNRLTFFGRTPSSQLFSNNNAFALNEWTHVAFSVDDGTLTFFKNGEAWGTTSATVGTDNTSNIAIGADWYDGYFQFFNGRVDDVRVWNVARAAQQIADNKDKHLWGSETGLVGYWKFNEGWGSTAYDSANSNDGAITLASWSDDVPF